MFIKGFLCILKTYAVVKLLKSSGVLRLQNLHEVISYALSIIITAVVHINNADYYHQCYVVFLVCVLAIDFRRFTSITVFVTKNVDFLKTRYISNFLIYISVKLTWLYPKYFAVFLIAWVCISYYSKSLKEEIYNKTASILKSRTEKINLSYSSALIALIIQVLFVGQHFTVFILLDLSLTITLSIMDYTNLTMIETSVKHGFNIKEKDISSLISNWKTSKSPERIAKILLILYNSNKLSENILKNVIKTGSSDRKLMTPSFITMVLPEITTASKDVTKNKILKEILQKDNVKQLNVVDLINLSNLTNESDHNILKRSIYIFTNCRKEINERIYVSNALIKQINLNPEFILQNRVKDSLKEIALKPKGKTRESKELLMSLIALQCMKSIMTELPYDFYEDYYKINIRPSLSSYNMARGRRLPEIKTNELLKLDKHLARHTLTNRERFSLLETLSVILYNEYTIDTSIFTNFDSKEWHVELLIYVLIGKALECDTEDWHETKVKALMEQVSLLKEFTREHDKNDRFNAMKMELILKSLINKQNEFKFNLTQITNILIVAQTQKEQIDILLNNDNGNFIEELVDMEFLWLKKICNSREIEINVHNITPEGHSELFQLRQVLRVYEVSTIKDLISKVPKRSKASDLISFFDILNYSPLTDYNKHVFLNKLRPDSVYAWKLQVAHFVVQLFICNEFPDYKSDRSNEAIVLYKDKSVLKKIKKQFNDLISLKNNERNTKFIDTNNVENKKSLNDILQNSQSEQYQEVNSNFYQMETKMAKLLSHGGWSLQQIAMVIQNLDSLLKIKELSKSVDIITEYNLNESKGLSKIFNASNVADLEANVLQYAIKEQFSGTFEKIVDSLFNELFDLNENRNIEFMKKLKKAYNEVVYAYEHESVLFPNSNAIIDWDASKIGQWVISLQGRKSEGNKGNKMVSQFEKIAVIKKAIEISTKIVPRSIQLMSVLLMINPSNEKGRLAQINTGEGKTTIIAMIAAYHGLHNHKVDIVTTSPVLAVPQCEQLKNFYSMLGLTVSHIVNNTSGYQADVCYGPVTEFEADVLRDECNKSERRHGRSFDIVLVDEVDSMFIDGNNHIVMLATDMPGMSNLETLLAAIVVQVESIANCIKHIDGKPYYLQPESRINDDGTLKDQEDVNAIPLNCTIEQFIKDATEVHIRKLVRDIEAESGYPEIQIPSHLRNFTCKIQIPKWIDSAIRAKYVYENTKHYILRQNKVMPVDAQNTGVVHENQHWNNGMHQFLQIKHGAKLYPESLTNNYISNVGYFKRYTNKIYGLTGTLGDDKSSKFLENVYGVDTVIIPPFKKKQHVDLIPTVTNTEEAWQIEIVTNCISKLKCGRAVLIITKYIKEIDNLYNKFKELKYDTSKIILFKTDEDVKVIEKIIKPGEVILTTNIAGRGTDLKLSPSIDEKGGLHVCLTFLPINTRVEQQNTGRTSRTGNRGTSQLILFDKNERDIKKIKDERNKNQRNIITQAEIDVEIVITKEKIFAEFLRLREEIKGRNEEKKTIEIVAVEERFALWLKMHEDYINKNSRSDVIQLFKTFKDDVLNDDRNNKLINNPYFYVLIGRKLMNKKKYINAIEEFSSAIRLDDFFSEHAYYNRGYSLLAQYGKNMKGNRFYIDDAIGDLKKARKLIQKREADLHMIQHASSGEIFSEQVQHKINLYNIQKQAIDLAIGPDKDEINEQMESLRKLLNSTPKENSEEINNMNESIKTLEADKNRKGIIDEAQAKQRNIEIKLMGISECLPDNEMESYREEIEEFNRNGFIGGFKVTEIKPIDWNAVFGLMILGLSQLIAGAALAVYTLGSGSTLAMSLISEGISDIIAAVKDGIINRDFNWATWAIQKAISITISIVCAGLKSIKDVAKTVSAGAKMLGNKVINETVKTGWKLVAKKIGTELAKGIAKEIVSDLANYGLEKTLIPEIQSKLIEIIEGPIQEALINNEHVKLMLKMDATNKNNNYENFIKSAAFDILDTNGKSKLIDIGKQIAIGIADGKLKHFSTARKIAEASMAVNKLCTFVPLFINKLNDRIAKKVKSDKIIEKEAENESKNNEESSKNKQPQNSSHQNTPQNNSKAHPTATQSYPDEVDIEGDININKGTEEQVKSKHKKPTDATRLSKVIVGGVSSKMLATIKGKMINPVLQAGVSYSMDKITSGLDSTLNHDIVNYRSLKRVIHHQNEGYKNTPKNSTKENLVNENDPAIGKANRIIEEARSGEKCGLPQLGAVSDVTDRPVEVYDENGRLKFTIGDKKGGEPLKVQHHKDIEHYTILGNKEPHAQGLGNNMCLYNVLSDQTGMDPDILKASTLDWMESNKVELSKQSGDISRLQMYDSLKLCLGGAKYDGKGPDDAGAYIDYSQNRKGHYPNLTNNPKYTGPQDAHPRGHASNQNATGPISSVEEYSKTDPKGKSGFDSYEAQNYVAHYALSHPKTQVQINQLNNTTKVTRGSIRQVVHLTAQELNLPTHPDHPEYSLGGKWDNTGKRTKTWPIQDVKLVLQHDAGQYKNSKANVFIQTIYPVDPNP